MSHLNQRTLVRGAQTTHPPHWFCPLLQVSSQPQSMECTISDSMGGMHAFLMYCVLSCIITTRLLLRVTMWTTMLVTSVCLMLLFFNWKREMWSTWSSARTPVFGMIPIIAPLLVDFYFLPCESICETPSALFYWERCTCWLNASNCGLGVFLYFCLATWRRPNKSTLFEEDSLNEYEEDGRFVLIVVQHYSIKPIGGITGFHEGRQSQNILLSTHSESIH